MEFAANQVQNESYTFKYMLLQPDNSYLIQAIIKEFEVHEYRSHWVLNKDRKVNNNHKNKHGNLKTILSIWSFKPKIFPY